MHVNAQVHVDVFARAPLKGKLSLSSHLAIEAMNESLAQLDCQLSSVGSSGGKLSPP